MTTDTPILILIGSLEAGGAQRMVLWLAAGLLDAGLDPHLASIDADMEMATASELWPRLAKRTTFLSGTRVADPVGRKLLAAPCQWHRLQRLLCRIRPRAVVSFMERANLLNLLTVGPHQRVLSVRSHPDLFTGKAAAKRFWIDLLYPLLLRRAATVVCNAAEAAAAFQQRYRLSPPCRVIPNHAPIRRIRRQAAAAPPPPPPGRLRILACGRFKPEKGFPHLLRAAAPLLARTNAELVLVGDGPLRSRLEEEARRLGVADRVRLPGFCANPMGWIASADIFVLPSWWEGFPNALLEAMALGRPVVAADCPSGPREILAPDSEPAVKCQRLEVAPHGILTPPLQPRLPEPGEELRPEERELGRALELLAADANLRRRLAAAAARRAESYTPERLLPAWLELLGAPRSRSGR